MHHSKALNMTFQQKKGFVKFEDGVIYKPSEIQAIMSLKDNFKTMQMLHNAKKLFDGIIIEYNEDYFNEA